MLKNGKCPQCGSSEVVTSEQGVGFDLQLYLLEGKRSTSTSDWTTYLCTACGLFENYVTDTDFLASTKSDPKLGWRPIS